MALPQIARHFATDIPTVQWVIISYTLTISALLLPMGRLSDIIGLKKVYIIGSLVFALFAFAAGLSNNLEVLIGSRVVQGAGAAMTQGTGMAIIAAAFPGNERGKAIGLYDGGSRLRGHRRARPWVAFWWTSLAGGRFSSSTSP